MSRDSKLNCRAGRNSITGMNTVQCQGANPSLRKHGGSEGVWAVPADANVRVLDVPSSKLLALLLVGAEPSGWLLSIGPFTVVHHIGVQLLPKR
jgi:hypothetical protein